MPRGTVIIASLALAGGVLILTLLNLPDRVADRPGSSQLAVSPAPRSEHRPATAESGPGEGGGPAVRPGVEWPAGQATREGDEQSTLPGRPAGRSAGKDSREGEGEVPRGHENRVKPARGAFGGGVRETLTGSEEGAGESPAVEEGEEPHEETATDLEGVAIDPLQTLNEIASVLLRETAWLDGPESGPVSDALVELTSYESLSETELRAAIARVLSTGASMLMANDDAEGAELALAAREAIALELLQDANALVLGVVRFYPVDRPQPGA